MGPFETTNALLGKLGYVLKAYQENRRRSLTLDGAELEVDTWSRIPACLEIKADSRAEVVRVAALLGYTEADLSTRTDLCPDSVGCYPRPLRGRP